MEEVFCANSNPAFLDSIIWLFDTLSEKQGVEGEEHRLRHEAE